MIVFLQAINGLMFVLTAVMMARYGYKNKGQKLLLVGAALVVGSRIAYYLFFFVRLIALDWHYEPSVLVTAVASFSSTVEAILFVAYAVYFARR